MHHMSVLSPELSRYRANDAEIVTRSQTKTWSFTQKCTNTTGDDSFQYTMMQLVMLAARFVHHMWVPRERVPSMHATCTHAAGTGWATSAHLPRRISS